MTVLLDQETLLKARKELNEIPGEKEEKVELLRKRIKDAQCRNELPQHTRLDDRTLIRFLRVKKYNVDKAMHKYSSYHRFRQKIPGMNEDVLTYHSVEEVIHSGIFDLTDGRSVDGCQGCIMYLSKWNLNQFTIEQVICTTLFILETLYDENEDLEIHGIRVLLDFSDYTFTQQLKTQAMFLTGGISMLMEFIQVAFPIRLKSIQLVNQAWYVTTLLAIVKPFMSQKLRSRLIQHGSNHYELYEHFRPEVLPISCGGTSSLTYLTELFHKFASADLCT